MEGQHRTRIAPTPSGLLHAGNGVAFLLTARIATMYNATLRLRIDDLDVERARPTYVEDIFESLAWLGIGWTDGPRDAADQGRAHSQVLRIAKYAEHIGILKEQGDLYACNCSRSEWRANTRGRNDCGCRHKDIPFTDADATWRLHLPADAVVRMEQLHGTARMLAPASLIPDPVIRQRASDGGRPAYQIASLIDDLDHATTIIVRGEDLLPSTACQLYLADRLGLETFKRVRFVHHSLITDDQGQKVSKSEGAEALRSMRVQGSAPNALKERAMQMLHELGAARAASDQSRP